MSERAASTKSRSRSARTSARTTRAHRSHPVRPGTRITVVRFGPSAAANASASNRAENDSDVDDGHEHGIDAAGEEAAQQAQRYAEDRRQHDGAHADEQRHAGTPDADYSDKK